MLFCVVDEPSTNGKLRVCREEELGTPKHGMLGRFTVVGELILDVFRTSKSSRQDDMALGFLGGQM